MSVGGLEIRRDDTEQREHELTLLFVREVFIQCRLAVTAYRSLSNADKLVPLMFEFDDTSESMEQYWQRIGTPEPGLAYVVLELEAPYNAGYQVAFLLVHSFLTHAANVSKILFDPPPPKKGHPFSKQARIDRAKKLRVELGIDDSSPLSIQDFRHDLEHFDERLETWFEQTIAGRLFDLFDFNQEPFGISTWGPEIFPEKVLRDYEADLFRLRVGLRAARLPVLAAEVEAVGEKAAVWIKTHKQALPPNK